MAEQSRENAQRAHFKKVTFTFASKEENGELMDPDKIMDGLSRELHYTLKAMSKAKDVNEKEVYSRIVKNLCKSLVVFFSLASEVMPLDSDDDLEEDIPF